MKVGVLGSGDVGRTLAQGFAARGHDVKLGSRSPESPKLRAFRQKARGNISFGSFRAAAEHGKIVVLSVHGDAAEAVLDAVGPEAFAGKLVIDTTNPLDFSGGAPTLFVGLTDSLGERVQRKIPQACVVKAFNTVSSEQMFEPTLPGKRPEMLICGNDAAAKRQVARIVREFGWAGVLDIGGIEGARWLEPLVPLWVRLGTKLHTWKHMIRIERP